VPVQPDGWLHDPFGADVVDGVLWGRGALDMKVAAAMLVKLQLECAQVRRSRRDLIVAYFADEEMGGPLGSRWVTTHRPDLFAGATAALGEIGGFNIDLPDGERAFMIQTAERGMLWLRIVIGGDGGHAAFSTGENPLATVASLISAISQLQVDEEPLAASFLLEAGLRGFVNGGAGSVDELTPLVRLGRRTRFTPTVISAGLKPNVIPDSVELIVDCRFIPGSKQAALDAIRSLLPPDAEMAILAEADGLEAPADAPIVDSLRATIQQRHPGAAVLPFVMPGGSDAQKLAAIGIDGYGFTPLVLPRGFPYLELFHAVNERVPVSAVEDGYGLLEHFVIDY
jgi:acetylornithine deacetylase/succinyl-diaminopimelate desuccinylase-like protein